MTAWQAQGGSLVFVTLTMRHTRSDALAVTLDAALSGWRRVLMGKSWAKFKARHGVQGYIRAAEVTLGENGWHPHIHALFFVDKPLDKAAVAEWQRVLYSRWSQYVTEFGGGMPSQMRGVDIRLADTDGQVVAQYLSKLQDDHGNGSRPAAAKGIGKEMARFDFKTGRGSSLMPFELLDGSAREDEADDFAAYRLWLEYYNATRGRRAITWSNGLLDLVGVEDNRTDQEIVDEAERAPLRFLVPAEAYDVLRSEPAVLALVLEAVEAENIPRALALSGGFVPEWVEAFSGGEVIDLETGEVLMLSPPPPSRSDAALLRLTRPAA